MAFRGYISIVVKDVRQVSRTLGQLQQQQKQQYACCGVMALQRSIGNAERASQRKENFAFIATAFSLSLLLDLIASNNLENMLRDRKKERQKLLPLRAHRLLGH